MTEDELNQRYYDEGWGHIVKAALGFEPINVESAARCVANYAADRIAELEGTLQLIAQSKPDIDGEAAPMHDDLTMWQIAKDKLKETT